MRILIQRVKRASVAIDEKLKSMINSGLLILVGIEESDGDEDIEWLVKKCVNLRIFDDEQGVMNKSILESGGDVLAVSQFTLMASTKNCAKVGHCSTASGSSWLKRTTLPSSHSKRVSPSGHRPITTPSGLVSNNSSFDKFS